MASSLPDSGTLSITTPPTTTRGADRAATASATRSPVPGATPAAPTPVTAAYMWFLTTSLSTHTVCARTRAPPRSHQDPSPTGKSPGPLRIPDRQDATQRRAPGAVMAAGGSAVLSCRVVLVAVATVAVSVAVAVARLGGLGLLHDEGLRGEQETRDRHRVGHRTAGDLHRVDDALL